MAAVVDQVKKEFEAAAERIKTDKRRTATSRAMRREATAGVVQGSQPWAVQIEHARACSG